MDRIRIRGGRRLAGQIAIGGAKNAALPLMAASILADEPLTLTNTPALADIATLATLLEQLGVVVTRDGRTTKLDCARVTSTTAPYDLVRKMRASVLVLGPLVARERKARVSLPGGCAIGVRPIDQHLKGLEALGCRFELSGGYVNGRVDRLVGAEIHLDMPTVTGTENILMAAVLAEGVSVIRNAAREPEIVDLAKFLRGMGARITGDGTSIIEVDGVPALRPGRKAHRILPDRIETGTYMTAAAITGGDIFCEGAEAHDLGAVIEALRAAGATVTVSPEGIRVSRRGPLHPVNIETRPHPGFPTDMQAQFLALMCLAKGESVITETIFENRFMHVPELQRMGASIVVRGNTAVVQGVSKLYGASVMATDLRASASLVIAGLIAEDETEVRRVYHLDRGYEMLEEKLRGVGADIERVTGVEG